MQIKSLQDVKTTKTSSHSLEDRRYLSLLSSLLSFFFAKQGLVLTNNTKHPIKLHENPGSLGNYMTQPQTPDSSPTSRISSEHHRIHLHPSQEASNVEEATRSRTQHHPWAAS
jgi:hypothetical protein